MKTKLSRAEKLEIKRLFWTLTSKELFDHINAQRNEDNKLGFTTFRTLVYKMGLKKCSILRWTSEETKFLLDNYQTMGNTEIAEKLSSGRRQFHKKNVEKKMKLLGIKRTRDEINKIIEGHKKRGVYHEANLKRWEGKRIPEGSTKVQMRNGKPVVMIKVDGILIPYARHRYKQIYGDIPRGYKVYFKDMNPLNISDDNLVARKARGLSAEERKKWNTHIKNYLVSQKLKTKIDKATKEKEKDIARLSSIPVRIDDRTIVYVKPGTNINKFIEQFKQKTAIV